MASIWTYGERLRFVTVKSGSITIWEVGFTSIHTLTEVESLPAPDDIGCSEGFFFLPTLSRLAFTLQEAVIIYNAQDSKLLLNFVGGNTPMRMSFSDGRFFACGTTDQEIHLWKESPAGYVLHQKLVSCIDKDMGLFRMADTGQLLSLNGELAITSISRVTRLWRTTDPITSLSGIPTQPARRTKLILGFSLGQSLGAAARLGDDVATVLDLKSGDPRLIIDTGMKIHGLKVIESTTVVVGDGRIITWSVPAGDCVFNARANIDDSVQTVIFNHSTPPLMRLRSTSISPDLNHVVETVRVWKFTTCLLGSTLGVSLHVGTCRGSVRMDARSGLWMARACTDGKSPRVASPMSSSWSGLNRLRSHQEDFPGCLLMTTSVRVMGGSSTLERSD